MQGVVVTVAGAGPFLTGDDGTLEGRAWPVGATLMLELDVDADGIVDRQLRHVLAADEPIALPNWLTLEVQQDAKNRAAFPIDSIGWSRRPGNVEDVETTCELAAPRPDGSLPWLRVPSKRLSLRSDWNLVITSGDVVDARPAEQRYGRHVLEVRIVPVGSFSLELGTEEAINLQVALRWRGPEGDGPEAPKPKMGADSVSWRDLPCGPYDIRVTSLNHEPWHGRVEIEMGAQVLSAGLQPSDCEVVRSTVAYATDLEGISQNLAGIDLQMQEEGGAPEPVTLQRIEFDEATGLGIYEGPAIRRGIWTVRPEAWLANLLQPAETIWTGPALHFTAEFPSAVNPSETVESRLRRVRIPPILRGK